jgi:hypothetical protein
LGQAVDALVHGLNRDGLGEIVVLIAIGTREIASPHRDNVGHDGMISRSERFADHPKLAHAPLCSRSVALQSRRRLWGSGSLLHLIGSSSI